MLKVAVITGGNKGLGFYQSLACLKAGYKVFILARSDGYIEKLKSVSDSVKLVKVDLVTGNTSSILSDIHADCGRIDALINNAGAHLKKPIWDVKPEEFDALISINLKAIFELSANYIKLQKEAGGSIVNISSMAGLMALPNAAAYVTTKTALIGLTRSVAVDAAPFGINCNTVCPGFIDTDMTRMILEKDPERRERIERRIPSGKFGSPDDVAQACLFLVSEQAKYINGAVLPVDAGYSIGF